MTPSSAAQFAALASGNTAAAFTQPAAINTMSNQTATPVINTVQAIPTATNSNFHPNYITNNSNYRLVIFFM